MLLLACYSEPELDPMWITLWCITIAVLLLIIVCIGARLLGGLYGNVPSDVINVYQPPGTDFYITFKSPWMRGRFKDPLEASLHDAPTIDLR
jgi:hypothetical protein